MGVPGKASNFVAWGAPGEGANTDLKRIAIRRAQTLANTRHSISGNPKKRREPSMPKLKFMESPNDE